jgi:putative redox protein
LELTDAFFADSDRFDPPRLLAALQPPLLVVHGDRDEIISVKEAHKARKFNPRGVELAIVKGADHMFSRDALRRVASAKVVAFFKQLRDGQGS